MRGSWAEISGTSIRIRTVAKTYRRGTHRCLSPAETIARVERHRVALGITRLANITGLDYLGVPVFAAMRPNARSISLSQGKGIDEESAVASALMEAAEIAHAENVALPIVNGSAAALAGKHELTDPARLPRLQGSRLTWRTPMSWVAGRNLSDGRPILVPFDLVHTDYTRPASRHFAQSSNGIASGNHRLEAVIAGLCEVIERDATALWSVRSIRDRAARRILIDSVTDPDAETLVGGMIERGLHVSLWDATTDIGIACILCRLSELPDNGHRPLGRFWGAGCHLDPVVALLRALTEAAQSRLTFIAGARDDLTRQTYAKQPDASLLDRVRDEFEQAVSKRAFAELPSLATDTLEGDVAVLLARLETVGLREIIEVDLTDEAIGIPVLRMIVPGLEHHHEAPGRMRPGARLAALADAGPR